MQPPPPTQLATFTTKGDIYFEENNEVEEDIHEGTNGGTFMEVEENEESCLGEVYVDFSNYISARDVNTDETKDDISSYDAMDTIAEGVLLSRSLVMQQVNFLQSRRPIPLVPPFSYS